MKRFLFIAVHPDDETLGCGGVMMRMSQEGHEIFWMILTSAMPGNQWSEEFIKSRETQINRIKEFYKVKEVIHLGFETTTLDTVPSGDLISKVSIELARIKPTCVFIPNKSDIHSDHRRGFEAVFSACKSFRAPYIQEIYMYECLSETEFAPPFEATTFIPNTWIDISDYLENKIEAMGIYSSEIKKAPFPRSEEVIRALAIFRGSRIGVHYAEAFSLLFSSNL